jgi:hypothetical protein
MYFVKNIKDFMRGFIYLSLFLLIACKSKSTNNLTQFEVFIKQIFFNAPIEIKNYDLVNYYTQDKNFEASGYTTYPSLTGLGDNSISYPFSFNKHEFLPAYFSNGSVIVNAICKNGKCLQKSLKIEFLFDNAGEWNKAIAFLENNFKGISKLNSYYDSTGVSSFEIHDSLSVQIPALNIYFFKSDAYRKPYVIIADISKENLQTAE